MEADMERMIRHCCYKEMPFSELCTHENRFYARLSKADYSRSNIKLLHDMLYPAFEMAVDDIIRKNPCKIALRDFGRDSEAREAITNDQ